MQVAVAVGQYLLRQHRIRDFLHVVDSLGPDDSFNQVVQHCYKFNINILRILCQRDIKLLHFDHLIRYVLMTDRGQFIRWLSTFPPLELDKAELVFDPVTNRVFYTGKDSVKPEDKIEYFVTHESESPLPSVPCLFVTNGKVMGGVNMHHLQIAVVQLPPQIGGMIDDFSKIRHFYCNQHGGKYYFIIQIGNELYPMDDTVKLLICSTAGLVTSMPSELRKRKRDDIKDWTNSQTCKLQRYSQSMYRHIQQSSNLEDEPRRQLITTLLNQHSQDIQDITRL